MAVDIKNLNHTQLNELISKAQIRQDELKKEKVQKLREKVHALIKAEGYSFDDIFGSPRKGRRAGTKVAPKYRNPGDSSITWSGRGKPPLWFKDALKSGKTEKSLLI